MIPPEASLNCCDWPDQPSLASAGRGVAGKPFEVTDRLAQCIALAERRHEVIDGSRL